MNQFNLYIGSDNTSGEVDIFKLTEYLNTIFDGYTITHGKGYWKSKAENMAIVTIFTTKTRTELVYIVAQLCRILKQDCIVLQSIKEQVNIDSLFDNEINVDFITGDPTN